MKMDNGTRAGSGYLLIDTTHKCRFPGWLVMLFVGHGQRWRCDCGKLYEYKSGIAHGWYDVEKGCWVSD